MKFTKAIPAIVATLGPLVVKISGNSCITVQSSQIESLFWPQYLHNAEKDINTLCKERNLQWNLRSTSISSGTSYAWKKRFECCEAKDIKIPENENDCKWNSNEQTPSFSDYTSKSYTRPEWVSGEDGLATIPGCAADGDNICPPGFYNFDGITSESRGSYEVNGEMRSSFDFCQGNGRKLHYCCPMPSNRNATCTVLPNFNDRVDCFNPDAPLVQVPDQGEESQVVLYNMTYETSTLGQKGLVIILTYEQSRIKSMEVRHNGQPTFKVDPSSSTDLATSCDRVSLVPTKHAVIQYPQMNYWSWSAQNVHMQVNWTCIGDEPGKQSLGIKLQKLDENFQDMGSMYESELNTYTGACTCNAVPTQSPTSAPTGSPTISPTASPSASPTMSPTAFPSVSPTLSPTQAPTSSPTKSPSKSPTKSPTKSPSQPPTSPP
mmetsp:Transcript_30091/g.47871  ORF Transcript_30091/g.47871 Transcript_30091/m.47871 type:complete len:434 (-) Transcript_30091:21-1322(-)